MRPQAAPPPGILDSHFGLKNGTPNLSGQMEQLFPISPGLTRRPSYPRQLSVDVGNLYQDDHASMTMSNVPDINSSVNFSADPWDPLKGDGSQHIMNQNNVGARQRMAQASMIGGQYWPQATRSNIESNITGSQPPHDSGYGSQPPPDTRSMVSWGRQSSNQECYGMTGRLSDMQFSHNDLMLQMQQSHSQDSQTSLPQATMVPLESSMCVECNAECKNKSDLKCVISLPGCKKSSLTIVLQKAYAPP